MSSITEIACFTEHHLTSQEIQSVFIDKFTCGAHYCRKLFQKGGVCIYVNNTIISTSLNLEVYCIDKEIEVCDVKFKLQCKEICILTIYRSPSGNFSNFINQLENIVHSLYNSKNDIIICGDMNVNYLEESSRVKQLNALLKTFNLDNVVTFPTRISRHSSTCIDTVFVDITRFNNIFVSPTHNGLSDHEGLVLTIDLPFTLIRKYQSYSYRKINTYTVADFLNQLSYVNWNEVFGGSNVNHIFNVFLNTYLRIFYSCFPLIHKQKKINSGNIKYQSFL